MKYEECTIRHGDVTAVVAPERGALVTSIHVRGKELLYLDRSTFEDPAKNVRGGIPVLFPFAGKLKDGAFVPAGTQMGQHGFGRNKPWKVTEQSESAVRMTLEQDPESRSAYPYEYVAEQSCLIVPNGLQMELLLCNTGRKPLPVAPGWHPYFTCTGAQKGSVRGDVPGLDPSRLTNTQEFDFGLPAPQTGRATFQIPGLGALTLSFSPRMRHLQFWSQPGKDFICLEPFTGPGNTLNTDGRVDVPPGEGRSFWMRIELTA